MIVCAPVALGPAGLAFLPLLKVKNELSKIGRSVFRAATTGHDDDYNTRLRKMRTAHALLVYTSFFHALDAALPPTFRKRVDIQEEDRHFLAARSGSDETCERQPVPTDPDPTQANPLIEFEVAFPHPTETLADQIQRHKPLWKSSG